MTHEELIEVLEHTAQDGMADEPVLKALRAVVKLHKPVKVPHSDYQSGLGCSALGCQDKYYEPSSYPCQTIQAIEKELG